MKDNEKKHHNKVAIQRKTVLTLSYTITLGSATCNAIFYFAMAASSSIIVLPYIMSVMSFAIDMFKPTGAKYIARNWYTPYGIMSIPLMIAMFAVSMFAAHGLLMNDRGAQENRVKAATKEYNKKAKKWASITEAGNVTVLEAKVTDTEAVVLRESWRKNKHQTVIRVPDDKRLGPYCLGACERKQRELTQYRDQLAKAKYRDKLKAELVSLKKLMVQEDKQIKEIARAVGYSPAFVLAFWAMLLATVIEGLATIAPVWVESNLGLQSNTEQPQQKTFYKKPPRSKVTKEELEAWINAPGHRGKKRTQLDAGKYFGLSQSRISKIRANK